MNTYPMTDNPFLKTYDTEAEAIEALRRVTRDGFAAEVYRLTGQDEAGKPLYRFILKGTEVSS